MRRDSRLGKQHTAQKPPPGLKPTIFCTLYAALKRRSSTVSHRPEFPETCEVAAEVIPN
jgi:hypothetical protein